MVPVLGQNPPKRGDSFLFPNTRTSLVDTCRYVDRWRKQVLLKHWFIKFYQEKEFRYSKCIPTLKAKEFLKTCMVVSSFGKSSLIALFLYDENAARWGKGEFYKLLWLCQAPVTVSVSDITCYQWYHTSLWFRLSLKPLLATIDS